MAHFNRINLLTVTDHLGMDCTINFQEKTGYIEVWLQESKAPFKCQFALLNPKRVATLREALNHDYSNGDCTEVQDLRDVVGAFVERCNG